ncbi:MAG TPA: rhodanese-like domain-containing protein [Burkholderiales bacterium]|nr:rhodanese-like domain-containing protein [Burkholderiales bacterium]
MLPGALAYSYLGYAGREALGGGEDLVRKGLIALALLGAVAFLPRLLARFRGTPVPEQISAAQLKQRLDGREDITVLDVRAAKDYAGELGHIDASLNIPLDQLPQRLAELDYVRERPIAVICRTNRMSGQAVEVLRRAGFKRVLLVSNGMLGWHQHCDA